MADQTRQTHQTEPKSPSSRQTETVEPAQQLETSGRLVGAIRTPTLQRLTPGVVLQLQRVYGNQFVNTLVTRAQETAADRQSRLWVPPGAGRIVQRDLATAPPEETPEAQDDLTPHEITVAMVHNGHRFDADHTRTIQDIIGTEQTGHFSREDIRAIAQIQEQYGLQKDGLIGPEMFRFLNDEMANENVDASDENCLVSFAVYGPDEVQGGATNNADGTKNVRIRGHFRIHIQFQTRCKPEDFQYRQFIQGTATVTRGSTVEDVSHFWNHIPGGGLPASFSEDGNTTWAAPHYGHRDQPGQPTTSSTQAENHYVDEDDTENQASGSIYKAEDFPEAVIERVHSGDVLNIHINFRGEIRRNGRVVQTRRWTAVNLTNFTLT